MNSNASALLLNILIIAAIFILNYFYQKNKFVFSLKCICSSAFALLGLINLGFAIAAKQANMQFYILMATALVLAMLGDVFIGKSFPLGAGLFALGHVCFMIAYFFLQGFSLREVWISALIFAASAALIALGEKKKSRKNVCKNEKKELKSRYTVSCLVHIISPPFCLRCVRKRRQAPFSASISGTYKGNRKAHPCLSAQTAQNTALRRSSLCIPQEALP